ncbi:uncharacterized protein H6S33_007488 [Morchella sextelata]|uniref:uncharacterized protein n=1 Tax=Morchella sextelata TaxID=1174677 RepID=UPI001D042360|nr:uncharacterized protein H6S33_007488 [Morchella sextelata]KAH0603829.1 hypothetical protein H6S33_007488 [Morchella sextelata]
MAEIVGPAAAIVALINVIGKAAFMGHGYREKVKGASEQIKRLVDELDSLKLVLISLQNHIEQDPDSLQTLRRLGPRLTRCEEDVQLLIKKLEKPQSRWRWFFRRLKWPLDEADTQQTIKGLDRLKNTFALALNADHISIARRIERNTKGIHNSGRMEQRRVVLGWIYARHFYKKHRKIKGRRHPHTGLWILRDIEFMKWFSDTDFQILWGHGIPGVGKTFLSSVLNALEEYSYLRDLISPNTTPYNTGLPDITPVRITPQPQGYRTFRPGVQEYYNNSEFDAFDDSDLETETTHDSGIEIPDSPIFSFSHVNINADRVREDDETTVTTDIVYNQMIECEEAKNRADENLRKHREHLHRKITKKLKNAELPDGADPTDASSHLKSFLREKARESKEGDRQRRERETREKEQQEREQKAREKERQAREREAKEKERQEREQKEKEKERQERDRKIREREQQERDRLARQNERQARERDAKEKERQEREKKEKERQERERKAREVEQQLRDRAAQMRERVAMERERQERERQAREKERHEREQEARENVRLVRELEARERARQEREQEARENVRLVKELEARERARREREQEERENVRLVRDLEARERVRREREREERENERRAREQEKKVQDNAKKARKIQKKRGSRG